MYFASLLFVLFTSPLWIFQVECASDLPEGSNILQINVIYRHGDRNPVTTYPKSKYRNASFWPQGFGQLTLNGMKQQYNFGRWLMNEYGPKGKKLLPSVYDRKDYKVFSTDVDRTIASGLANTAGIYYPMPGRGIENDIRWQPIPIRAIPADEDDEIFAQFCPAAKKAFHSVRTRKIMQIRERNQKLFQYAQDHSGDPIVRQPERLIYLYDTLLCEKNTFGEIPKWAEEIFPYPLKYYRMEYFKLRSSTDMLKRLSAGPLIKAVIENMNNKMQGKDTTKMYSYSAHDTTVFPILDSLYLRPEEPPGYTAAIIFELYISPGNSSYVQTLYRPGPEMESKPLIVPGCHDKQFCPLGDFIKITAHLIPDDLKKECLG